VLLAELEDRYGLTKGGLGLSPPAHPDVARSPRSNSPRGPPTSWERSCAPPPGAGCSPPSGSARSLACVANELLGLRWDDFDPGAASLSVNRGLIAVAYELHETRGKTRNARRSIDLDPTTVEVLVAWRQWQRTEQAAAGIDTPAESSPTAPASRSILTRSRRFFERIARRAGVPLIRLHDRRHTHGTLLIKADVPAKVVSERLGHATPAFTIDTCQHVLPGMQADAARTFEQLLAPALPPTVNSREKTRLKRQEKTTGQR
jgi:hypothetical protein